MLSNVSKDGMCLKNRWRIRLKLYSLYRNQQRLVAILSYTGRNSRAHIHQQRLSLLGLDPEQQLFYLHE